MMRLRKKKPSVPSCANAGLFFETLEERSLLAAVVTDKLDYAPAETALITATDYHVGDVHLSGYSVAEAVGLPRAQAEITPRRGG